MKLVSEPVKYKQRYRWSRVNPADADWDACNEKHGVYWDRMWIQHKAHELGFVIISVPEVGYFIASDEPDVDPRCDLGPYPDLPTVKSVAETFIDLKHCPEWPLRRRKRGF